MARGKKERIEVGVSFFVVKEKREEGLSGWLSNSVNSHYFKFKMFS